MTFPIVQLSGNTREQGRQHGELLKDRIHHNLALYFERFKLEVQLERDEVLSWAEQLFQNISQLSPDYAEGIRGISEGSGRQLLEIAALNVRYEILYYQFGVLPPTVVGKEPLIDGCTAFAVLPETTANKHTIMGQNWDWIPAVQGAVLHTKHDDGLESAAFTEAGIFGGKIGLNNAGIGLGINGMMTTDDDWQRKVRPVHVRCFEILRAKTFDQAVGIVTNEARACSTNYLIAQAGGQIADLEAAPNGVHQLPCSLGVVTHANHFSNPDGLGIIEPPSERRDYSKHRNARLYELLTSKQNLSISEIQEHLRDHNGRPNSICRHEDMDYGPEEHYITMTGAVMDLDSRELWISDGPPCTNEFQHIKLG